MHIKYCSSQKILYLFWVNPGISIIFSTHRNISPCICHDTSWLQLGYMSVVPFPWCSQITIPCFLWNTLLHSQNAQLCIIHHKVPSRFCSSSPQVHPNLPWYCIALPVGWSAVTPARWHAPHAAASQGQLRGASAPYCNGKSDLS